jgi:hypothetical protein
VYCACIAGCCVCVERGFEALVVVLGKRHQEGRKKATRIILSTDRPPLPGKITPRNTRAFSPIHARKQVPGVLPGCPACVLGCSGKALHLAKRGRARAMRPHQKPRPHTEAAAGREGSTSRFTHTKALRFLKRVCADTLGIVLGGGGVRTAWGWCGDDAVGHGKKKEGRQAGGGSCALCFVLCALCVVLCVMKGLGRF